MVGRAASVGGGTTFSSDEAREKNYWINPRDHARRKAKKEIWERVHSHVSPPTKTTSTSTSTTMTTPEGGEKGGCGGWVGGDDPALVASIVRRIVADDASYFSLATLQRHRELMERPVDASLLYGEDDGGSADDSDGAEGIGGGTLEELVESRRQERRRLVLVANERLLSMLGPGPYEDLRARLGNLQTFTFYEYAVWVGRPRIVGAMLLGGINPCVRGRGVQRVRHSGRDGVTHNPNESDGGDPQQLSDAQALEELHRLGRERVVPRLFDGVPVALATYVVQRVVELRRSGGPGASSSSSSSSDARFSCPLCPPSRRDWPTCVLLGFDSSDPCSHSFCEPCFWSEMVRNLTDRQPRDDVVQCPVCDLEPSSFDSSMGSDDECAVRPTEGRLASLERFLALPADAAALKRVAPSKRRNGKLVRPAVASTWSDAVRPLVGRTKEVRRDRFWRYVEDPHGKYHHHVRGCLYEGIDVFETNQYGQTPLFVAALSGNLRGVQLLLRYHAPDDVRRTGTAHGGIHLVSAAQANGHHEIVKTLLEHLETGPVHGAGCEEYSIVAPPVPLESLRHAEYASRSRQPAFTILVDPEADLQGAGSYVIDDCLSDRSLEILKGLWTVLPDASDVKKKDVPCSTRRYFCDAEGHIQSALVAAMGSYFDGSCVVFPHMRFLCYSEPNVTLLPHVDLPRTDVASGVRSTHTLLLYLTDCEEGGATCLLTSLNESDRSVVARVRPQRARLFLFPHECPHEGEAVVDVPKLLLRGEARLPTTCRDTKI